MQKKVEIKKDGEEFTRFDTLLRKVVSVPKDELIRREKEEKRNKEEKKGLKV